MACTLFARDANAWSSYKVSGYTLDISLVSETEATANLDLEIEVLGGRFRGFKIARGDEGLKWIATSMYCENTSGKRFVLRRVPRADGLTDFKFVTPGFIPRGTTVCSTSYEFDPSTTAGLSLIPDPDPESSTDAEKLRLSYKTPGLPVAVENWVVTLHLPRKVTEDDVILGDFTSEEYVLERYPMALTFKRYRPPAYYTGQIEALMPPDLLGTAGGDAGSGAGLGIAHLDRFIGIPDSDGSTRMDGLWMFALLAMVTLMSLALKHRATETVDGLSGSGHPYLLMPAAGVTARLAVSGSMLVLYVVLAAAGHSTSALLTLAAVFAISLRGGLSISAGNDEPVGRFKPIETRELRRVLRAAAWRDARARMFLDATTIPGAVIALLCASGLVALRLYVLTDNPQTANLLMGSCIVVFSFVMFTSTRLGGRGHLSTTSARRLGALMRHFDPGEFRPQLCRREDDAQGPWPELRCRVPIASQGDLGRGVVEVGIEWSRGWAGWRSCYAVVIRLGARAGAMVADADWLERAEVHARVEEGLTAIVVRTRDPLGPAELVDRVARNLDSTAATTDMQSAIASLGSTEQGQQTESTQPT